MNISPVIAAAKEELEAIYKDLHAHPELGFEETRTSEIVAEKLAEYGVDEVHTGLGKIKGQPARRSESRHGCIAD